MAKKSKPPVKEGTGAAFKEEDVESVNKETRAPGNESEGMDFIKFLEGGGVLIGVLLVFLFIFRYLLHMI